MFSLPLYDGEWVTLRSKKYSYLFTSFDNIDVAILFKDRYFPVSIRFFSNKEDKQFFIQTLKNKTKNYEKVSNKGGFTSESVPF